MIFVPITTVHGGGERRTLPCDGRNADEEDAHASASKAHTFPVGAGCNAGHHRRRAEKVDLMKTITHTPIRVATAIATFVALISSVGAPFKWS
jgi:hypothetical protein